MALLDRSFHYVHTCRKRYGNTEDNKKIWLVEQVFAENRGDMQNVHTTTHCTTDKQQLWQHVNHRE